MKTLSSFLILCILCFPLFSIENQRPDSLKEDHLAKDKVETESQENLLEDTRKDKKEYYLQKPVYEESAFRRAEIVFLLATPFVFIAHFLVVGTLNSASTSERAFELPPNSLGFVLVSSLAVSSIITYRDYLGNQVNTKALSQAKGQENVYSLKTSYRF